MCESDREIAGRGKELWPELLQGVGNHPSPKCRQSSRLNTREELGFIMISFMESIV